MQIDHVTRLKALPLTPSGLDATAPHLTWNGDQMKQREATFFELSGCSRRYHAPTLGRATVALVRQRDLPDKFARS